MTTTTIDHYNDREIEQTVVERSVSTSRQLRTLEGYIPCSPPCCGRVKTLLQDLGPALVNDLVL